MTEPASKTLRGVVAIGGSAGGVEALRAVARSLPTDLPFAVLMALHLPEHSSSALAPVIDRAGPLPAVAAQDGMHLEAGRIYVAVPGRHLLTDDHRIALSDGPSENGHRPALNALLRSVAVTFGSRAIGMLVSGVLDDGVLGLAAIRSRGGTTVCQAPEDALFAAMPLNALRAGVVDHRTRAQDVGPLLARLDQQGFVDQRCAPDESLVRENRIALGKPGAADDSDRLGPPSGYTCPDCNGSLQTVSDDSYRCHIGHAWTADSLLMARDGEIHRAVLIAVRSLQEKSRLAHRLADKAVSAAVRDKYTALAVETDKAVATLRERIVISDAALGGSG